MASKAEGKKKVEKRAWSASEEDVLLGALKDLVVKGWKTDNGFKAGYINQLEEAMQKVFPGTDIRGKPHIESKLTGWKRTYAILRDILGRSGVGFNLTGDNRIDCDDVLWEELCRPDPSIKNWRRKSWNYFEDWKMVFGKDRATGDGAAQLMDMVNDLMGSVGGQGVQQPTTEDVEMGGAEDQSPSLAPQDSVGQSSAGTSKSVKNSKKRQFDESISSLVDLVGDMQQTNVAKYQAFEETFVKKAVITNPRADLWSLLQAIPGFTMEEMFDVGEKLLEMPSRLELFFGLSADARPAYVQRILRMGD